MQSSDRPSVTGGERLIVLDELVGNAQAPEDLAIVGLRERAAGVDVSAGPRTRALRRDVLL